MSKMRDDIAGGIIDANVFLQYPLVCFGIEIVRSFLLLRLLAIGVFLYLFWIAVASPTAKYFGVIEYGEHEYVTPETLERLHRK